MKKSVLLLASLFLLSCSSDNDTPTQAGCNCGTITKVVVGGTVMGNTLRTYTIKNDCSGVVTVKESPSIVSVVGDKICD